jgi:hypothetical protein
MIRAMAHTIGHSHTDLLTCPILINRGLKTHYPLSFFHFLINAHGLAGKNR